MTVGTEIKSVERVRLWEPLAVLQPRTRRLVWAALALLALAQQGPSFLTDLLSPGTIGDFFQDWASARNHLEGIAVYAPHSDTIPAYLGVHEEIVIHIPVNAHPPPSVLIAIPFALFEYTDAVRVWRMLSLVCLAAAILMIARGRSLPVELWAVFPAIVLLMLCSPLRAEIRLAQFNGLLTCLLVLVWFSNRRGYARLAGIVLGLASAVKLYPGFLFLYFAARRQWTTVRWGAASTAATFAASLALLGTQTHIDYVQTVLPGLRGFQGAVRNISLQGFWSRLLDPQVAEGLPVLLPLAHWPVLAAVFGAGSALVLAGWTYSTLIRSHSGVRVRAVGSGEAENIGTRDGLEKRGDHAYGLAIVAMLLVSPITWDHYLLVLLLPLALLWCDLPASPMARLAFLTAFGLTMAPHYAADLPGGRTVTVAASLTVLSIQTYLLLGLYLWEARAALLRPETAVRC